MKRLLTAAGLLIVSAGMGLAADFPTKAPAGPTASWTGCYVGINGGYGWSHGRSNYNDPNTTPDPINGIQNPDAPPDALFIPGPPSPSQKGWMGGGGAGCNWQNQQWVFGVEADFDGGDIAGSQTNPGPLTAGDAAINGYFIGSSGAITANPLFIANATERVALRWLSTVRGRLGFAVQDRLLLFATGGLAVGGANTSGSVDVFIPGSPPGSHWSGSNSKTLVGYVVGSGAEWAFADRWTAKAEYFWYDLGSISHPLNCTATPFGCGTPDGYGTLGNTSSSVRGSLVRVGINYRFN